MGDMRAHRERLRTDPEPAALSQPVSPWTAIGLLRGARDGGDHEFWPCDQSLLDEQFFDGTRLHGPRQVTDAYLLALAVEHGGRFVTLDRTVSMEAVRLASRTHLVVLQAVRDV